MLQVEGDASANRDTSEMHDCHDKLKLDFDDLILNLLNSLD